MQRISRKGILTVSVMFGVAVFFLLAVSAMSWVSRAAVSKSRSEYDFLQRVDRELIRLKLLVVDAETGQRGYLITGDPEYLEPYSRSMAEKEAQIESIRDLLAGRSELSEDLPVLFGLIGERDKELLAAIETRQNSDFESTRQVVSADVPKQLTDRIRVKIDEIRSVVARQMAVAETGLASHLNRGTVVTSLVSVAALLSGLVGLAILIHQLRSHTETIELERDRERAEKADREKSRFLASMSHEIRTPLNAMLGFTELLDSEVAGDKPRKYLRAVRESGESLIELINDVLDLSKIESGILELDFEPVSIKDFSQTISMLFSQQATDRGLDYAVTVEPECPNYVDLDSLRFRQILVNLIGNALKFTSVGRVDVSFDATDVTEKTCTLLVHVKDTGRGIAPEGLEEIFKPFRQARAEDEMIGGTGLGLSISQELATLMGGTLSVVSSVGVGSTFTLNLPGVKLAEEGPELEESDNVFKSFDLLSPSAILVVDDNPFNRELVAGYLDDSHHRVSFASNGREALEQMARVEPDVVLMDIRMPVMDGQEARKRIKADSDLCETPVIAVTASSLLRQEKILRRQFDGYLRKPFSRAQLFGVLNRCIPIIGDAEESAKPDEEPEPVEGTDAGPMPGELREKLQIIREEVWDNLTSTMSIGDVTEISDELRRLAEEFSYGPLSGYAAKLREHATSFEQSKLEKALDQFDEFIETQHSKSG